MWYNISIKIKKGPQSGKGEIMNLEEIKNVFNKSVNIYADIKNNQVVIGGNAKGTFSIVDNKAVYYDGLDNTKTTYTTLEEIEEEFC